MEEHRVVLFALLKVENAVRIGEVQGDVGSGCDRFGGILGGEEGEGLDGGGVGWVVGGTGVGDEERVRGEEDLVGVGEDGVDGAGEGGDIPHVDQRPGVMPGFSLANRDEDGLAGGQLGLQREACQEGHAGDLDVGDEGEEGFRCGKGEGVFTGAGFDAVGGDLVLEEAEVAGFIVPDLLDTLVGGVGPAGGGEGGRVEGFHALLVEGEYDPFGGEEILEEEVVEAWGAGRRV